MLSITHVRQCLGQCLVHRKRSRNVVISPVSTTGAFLGHHSETPPSLRLPLVPQSHDSLLLKSHRPTLRWEWKGFCISLGTTSVAGSTTSMSAAAWAISRLHVGALLRVNSVCNSQHTGEASGARDLTTTLYRWANWSLGRGRK